VEGVNPVNAKAETVELPIQANIQILEWLKREIYSDAMVMDPSEITGGSLTNVAIKTANHAERLKTSSIEWQASLFIERILALADIESNSIVFKQETISNDMEITQRLSQYPELDLESKMKLDPLFPDDVIPEILQRVANNQIGYQEVVPEDPMVSE